MHDKSFVLTQFLKLLPRYEFQRLVDKYNGNHRTRSFKCWDQHVSHPVDKELALRNDQEIKLTSARLKKFYPKRLGRISFRDEENSKTLVFLTNHFGLAAEIIAALYKMRWEIELFFKWIKQNLKVKTFLGTSANAVKTQIRVALVVYLELAIIKERCQIDFPLSKMLHFLKVNLFEQKPLLSAFAMNERKKNKLPVSNQLKIFDD